MWGILVTLRLCGTLSGVLVYGLLRALMILMLVVIGVSMLRILLWRRTDRILFGRRGCGTPLILRFDIFSVVELIIIDLNLPSRAMWVPSLMCVFVCGCRLGVWWPGGVWVVAGWCIICRSWAVVFRVHIH